MVDFLFNSRDVVRFGLKIFGGKNSFICGVAPINWLSLEKFVCEAYRAFVFVSVY